MSQKKIMLIEDNLDDIDLIKRALSKNNIQNELIVISDSISALDYLTKRGQYASLPEQELPSVILLDLNLPVVNGFELLRQIRNNERTKLVPVVILTSSEEEEDIVNGFSHGANSYVRKPLVFEEFLDAISKIGMYWLLLNEPPSLKRSGPR